MGEVISHCSTAKVVKCQLGALMWVFFEFICLSSRPTLCTSGLRWGQHTDFNASAGWYMHQTATVSNTRRQFAMDLLHDISTTELT